MTVVEPQVEDLAVGAATPDPLTFADLLSTAPLRAAEPSVLCAAERLDQPVRWVHAGEVSDIGYLLRGGEVLLTTGLGVGHKQADQRRFVETIAERGAVGVVLELGTAFPDAPEAMVAKASAVNLPLVTLSRSVRFVDVTEVAHRRILGAQLGGLRLVETVHRELLALMLDGADTAKMLEWLAQRLGIALSLVRNDGHVLFHAAAGAHGRQDMLEAHARTAVSGHGPMAFPIPSPSGGAPLRLTLPCHDGPLETAERQMLTRASDLIALSLLRRRQETTLLARERGETLAGLISGELSEQEAEARASELDWGECELLLPAVVAGRSPRQIRDQQDSWSVILHRAQDELAAFGIPLITGLIDGGEGIAAIVGVPAQRRNGAHNGSRDQAARRVEIASRVAKVVHSQAERLLPGGGRLCLCVGEPAQKWTEVGARLRDVVELSPISPVGDDLWLDLGRPDVDLLIKRLLGNEVVERFAQRRLAALEEHDSNRKSELIGTLEALFQHNGNKADTARDLFVERQSLYSRLQRIEELLGERLSDEHTRLGLQLALHVRRTRAAATPS